MLIRPTEHGIDAFTGVHGPSTIFLQRRVGGDVLLPGCNRLHTVLASGGCWSYKPSRISGPLKALQATKKLWGRVADSTSAMRGLCRFGSQCLARVDPHHRRPRTNRSRESIQSWRRTPPDFKSKSGGWTIPCWDGQCEVCVEAMVLRGAVNR